MKSLSVLLLVLITFPLLSCSQNTKPMKVDNSHLKLTPESYTPPVSKSNEEWKKDLDDMEFYVLREAGTERAYTGEYYDHKAKGDYLCRACGFLLFSHDEKYDSNCGWPSFYDVKDERVTRHADYSHGMNRIEVRCANCGGHLGHVFPDGPKPTGIRYCINSVSLTFRPLQEGTE